MSAASTETSAPLPTAGSRVFFQPSSGVGCVGSGPITSGEDPVQKKQGKVTVKYDRERAAEEAGAGGVDHRAAERVVRLRDSKPFEQERSCLEAEGCDGCRCMCVLLHTVSFTITMSERSCMELGEGTGKEGQCLHQTDWLMRWRRCSKRGDGGCCQCTTGMEKITTPARPDWEEEMPEVEIDIDDLLEVTSDDERASKLQESLTDCYKPTEDFVRELLCRIRGMRKLSAPTKKGL
ncbi:unnamed protein product [Tetraodon nigroviridis]|uniref:(spotted green pufferfish) hypothetical protein n=1 Tax=Tetraodon nigroviridis TaxID=99883 RepID=Q4RRA1_TETNG|nr:unnamed protein product [Tetraodon nigroviridis]